MIAVCAFLLLELFTFRALGRDLDLSENYYCHLSDNFPHVHSGL
jgi:hypothetical protein